MEWRRLHNEEGGDRSSLKILTGKPTGKRLLGMPRSRWEKTLKQNRCYHEELD